MPEASLVIGVDRPKDAKVLQEAYDDPAGITAAFNQNLLQRINRELDGDFDIAAFAHKAVWNVSESRIEMHLESLVQQQVSIAGETVTFAKGETIHTENSHKYSEEAFEGIASDGGWQITDVDSDENYWFSVYTLQAA